MGECVCEGRVTDSVCEGRVKECVRGKSEWERVCVKEE